MFTEEMLALIDELDLEPISIEFCGQGVQYQIVG